jgi:hypothetical protein
VPDTVIKLGSGLPLISPDIDNVCTGVTEMLKLFGGAGTWSPLSAIEYWPPVTVVAMLEVSATETLLLAGPFPSYVTVAPELHCSISMLCACARSHGVNVTVAVPIKKATTISTIDCFEIDLKHLTLCPGFCPTCPY